MGKAHPEQIAYLQTTPLSLLVKGIIYVGLVIWLQTQRHGVRPYCRLANRLPVVGVGVALTGAGRVREPPKSRVSRTEFACPAKSS